MERMFWFKNRQTYTQTHTYKSAQDLKSNLRKGTYKNIN